MKGGKPEKDDHNDGGGKYKVPFKKLEGVNKAIQGLVPYAEDPAEDKDQENGEKGDPNAVTEPKGNPLFLYSIE